MSWEEQYSRDLASQTHSGPVPLDDHHRAKNLQLRERVRDLLPIDDVYKLSDCDLLYRFLIGKHWNLQTAEQCLRTYAATRQSERLNEILLTEVSPEIQVVTSPLYGVDCEGFPVLWITPEPTKLLVLLRSLPRQTLLRAQMRVMEGARYIAKAHGVERCTYVIDLGKVTMSSINTLTLGFMRELLKMLQDFYPEIMRRLLVYNTGWAVTAGWKMVKPFVDVRIIDKIHFFHDAPTVATLAEFMSAENVLPTLGGTGKEDKLAMELQAEIARMRARRTPSASPADTTEAVQDGHTTKAADRHTEAAAAVVAAVNDRTKNNHHHHHNDDRHRAASPLAAQEQGQGHQAAAAGIESPRVDRLLIDEQLIVTPAVAAAEHAVNAELTALELHSLSSSFTESMYDAPDGQERAKTEGGGGSKSEQYSKNVYEGPRMVIAAPAVLYTQQQQQQQQHQQETVREEAKTHAEMSAELPPPHLIHPAASLATNVTTSASHGEEAMTSEPAASLSSTSADYHVNVGAASSTPSSTHTAAPSETTHTSPSTRYNSSSSSSSTSSSNTNSPASSRTSDRAAAENEKPHKKAKKRKMLRTVIAGIAGKKKKDGCEAAAAQTTTQQAQAPAAMAPDTRAANCLCLQLVRDTSTTSSAGNSDGEEGGSRVVAYQDGVFVAEYRRNFVLGPAPHEPEGRKARSPSPYTAMKNTASDGGNHMRRAAAEVQAVATSTPCAAAAEGRRGGQSPCKTPNNTNHTNEKLGTVSLTAKPFADHHGEMSGPHTFVLPPTSTATRIHFAGPIIGELLREYGHPIHNYLIVCNAERQARFVVRKSRLRSRLTVFRVDGQTAVRTDAALRHTLSQSKRHKMAIVAAHPAMRGAKSTWVLYGGSHGAGLLSTSASAVLSSTSLTASALLTLRKGWRQRIANNNCTSGANMTATTTATTAMPPSPSASAMGNASRAGKGSEGGGSARQELRHGATTTTTISSSNNNNAVSSGVVRAPSALLGECHPDCVYYYAPLSLEYGVAELFTLTMAISQMWGDG